MEVGISFRVPASVGGCTTAGYGDVVADGVVAMGGSAPGLGEGSSFADQSCVGVICPGGEQLRLIGGGGRGRGDSRHGELDTAAWFLVLPLLRFLFNAKG